MSEEEALTLLLSDDDRPDPAANMGVDMAHPFDCFRRAKPKVAAPPGQVLADIVHTGGDRPPPVGGRHLPHFRFQLSFRFGRGHDGDFSVFTSGAEKSEPQEGDLVRFTHTTFRFIDLEPHTLFQEVTKRRHDALSGAFALHEDIAIIGVPNEPQASPRQFPIQFIKDDVGKARRERPPLRSPFLNGDLRTVRHHHRRCQHQAYQSDYPLVLHAVSDPGEQALMMDVVKKFGQIQINDRLITFLEIACRFCDGGVSTALWSEPVAAGVEGRFEDRLQYLENGLLHRPVVVPHRVV